MANLDTMSKRGSGINPVSPWRGAMVFSFISFGQGDRQAADYMYSGILAAGAPTSVLISQYKSLFRGVFARIASRVN